MPGNISYLSHQSVKDNSAKNTERWTESLIDARRWAISKPNPTFPPFPSRSRPQFLITTESLYSTSTSNAQTAGSSASEWDTSGPSTVAGEQTSATGPRRLPRSAIVGITLGSAATIALLVVVVILLVRHRQRRSAGSHPISPFMRWSFASPSNESSGRLRYLEKELRAAETRVHCINNDVTTLPVEVTEDAVMSAEVLVLRRRIAELEAQMGNAARALSVSTAAAPPGYAV
ncbi:hypothetical protein C8R43DRAFT_1112313 [Mycena crocata]|nr:hypothetical protein C8R43DRAFT_1112313 [Mycena crocata]